MGSRPLPAADLIGAITEADVLVAATAAPSPVVRLHDVLTARRSAAGRALFVLDLGLPSNVEAAVGDLPDVVVADLTTLGGLGPADVPVQVHQARSIISSEVTRYLARQEQAALLPVVAALHARIRQIGDAELDRLDGSQRTGLTEGPR